MKHPMPPAIDPLVEIKELEAEYVDLAYLEAKLRRFIRRENAAERDAKRRGEEYFLGYKNAATQHLSETIRHANWVGGEIKRMRDKHVRNIRWPEVATRAIKILGIVEVEKDAEAEAA